MRIPALAVAVALLASTSLTQAAERPLQGDWTDHINFTLSNRTRGEFVDYFEPQPGKAADGAQRYDFLANQFRFGTKISLDPLVLVAEMQHTLFVGLPNDASLGRAAGGNLGTGAIYYQHTKNRDQEEVFLKQGFAVVTIPGLKEVAVTGGRFDYADGLEVVPTDPGLAWLKKARLAERLVGPFGFTHVTRSFDGFKVAYDSSLLNITAMGSRPTQGGFEISANRELDAYLAGLALTFKELLGSTPSDVRLFYLYFDDQRSDPNKVDNRLSVAKPSALDHQAIQIHTFGTHAAALWPIGPGKFDALLWGAVQTGAWGEQNHFGWAYAAEVGYQLPAVFSSPWLRGGFNQGSGDSNARDNTHDTFFQVLPTARIYAQFPFYNLMNSEDLFAQLILKPHPMVTLRTDYHWLQLSQTADLLYSGGGASNNQVFGYAGLDSGGKRDLAQVVEASITVNPLKQIALQGYVARAFGGGAIAHTYAGRNANYGFLEMTYRH